VQASLTAFSRTDRTVRTIASLLDICRTRPADADSGAPAGRAPLIYGLEAVSSTSDASGSCPVIARRWRPAPVGEREVVRVSRVSGWSAPGPVRSARFCSCRVIASRCTGETLAHFAVVLARTAGSSPRWTGRSRTWPTVEALADAVRRAADDRLARLDDQQAAAVRADLAKWVSEVLFLLYPSARESVRECWDKHPDAVTELSACWLEFRRIFTPAAPLRSASQWPPSLRRLLVYLDRWLQAPCAA